MYIHKFSYGHVTNKTKVVTQNQIVYIWKQEMYARGT